MKLVYKNILDCSENIQNEVRIWRNSEDVKKYMYNDHEISIEEHKRWLNSLKDKKNIIVFVIFNNEEPIGIVSINDINYNHLTASWAFYLKNNSFQGTGIGSIIEYDTLNYVFNELKLEKLNCEVLEFNFSVIKLHKKFGFKEEGIRRNNIVKDNKRINVVLLGITKDEWFESKIKIEAIISRLK